MRPHIISSSRFLSALMNVARVPNRDSDTSRLVLAVCYENLVFTIKKKLYDA